MLMAPGESGYDDARQIWNGMIDKRPALIARCRGVADIINSVNFARAHDLLVAVRGGGHNVAGNATCDGGLVIDLSEMRSIRVDPVQRTARAEAGATWGEFDRETQALGLATPGGQISTTGLAGLTLGGGWGHLARRYGLASDNLISADLIAANGHFLTVSKTVHPELFWGLRGGGGNFGVVTSLEYQLHPVGPVMGGLVAYPMEQAKEVLRLFRDLTAAAPDELASDIVLITMPDGTPIVGMVICYTGPTDEGERILRPLKTFTPIVMDALGPITYIAAQRLVDDFYPKGLQNYWKSSFLGEISGWGDRYHRSLLRKPTVADVPRSHRTSVGRCGKPHRARRDCVQSPERRIQLHEHRSVCRPERGRGLHAMGARILGGHAALFNRWRLRELSGPRSG
jgi:hypothetical protein